MTAPPTVWHANADVSIRRDQYDTHGHLRVMDAISLDASAKLHRQIEKLVLATPPGTRLCLHTPEAWIMEREDYGSSNEVTRFQQFVHIVGAGDGCPPGKILGGAVVYASPWPCAFCWQRRARNYETACESCFITLHRKSPWFSPPPPPIGDVDIYLRGTVRYLQHQAWMQGYREQLGEG